MREALTLVERVERSLLSKISDQELEAGFREALKLDEMLSAEPTASKTEDADVPR
jgi:hypothetical protein